MKKNNPEIKNEYTLTMQDEIDAITMIANIFFKDIENEDGTISTIYTPYLEKIGQVNAISRYFISGIEFEENEDVYNSVMNDKDIRPLIDNFSVPFDKDVKNIEFHQKIFCDVMDKVYDIVDYRKAVNLAQIQNESNSVLTYKLLELIDKETEKNEREIQANEKLSAWIDKQREYEENINKLVTPEMQKNFIENFDINGMVETIYKKISEGDLHKKNLEIRDANRTIREQKNKIIELQDVFTKEKQKENAKNVVSDKPKRTTKSKKTE